MILSNNKKLQKLTRIYGPLPRKGESIHHLGHNPFQVIDIIYHTEKTEAIKCKISNIEIIVEVNSKYPTFYL